LVVRRRVPGGVEAFMSNGQSIVIKGDITGSEDLVIAGRVEGSITLNGRVLTLAVGSHVVGEIKAGTVVLSGTLDGTVEAKERLDIKSTALVDGKLNTARLIVADGSQISAKVEMPKREAQRPKLAVAG
jgi:cytoskeletal protein CcmA (bactofilin family)